MLAERKLIIDTTSDVYAVLKPWAVAEFWDFASHEPVPDSVYVIGRKQFTDNVARVKDLCQDPRFTIVFDNVAEGSETLVRQIGMLDIGEQVRRAQILVLSGGPMLPEYPSLVYDHFLSVIFDYQDNHAAITRTPEIFSKKSKPHSFLFLNGRSRPHRRYLIESLRSRQLLDRALWTNLDSRPAPSADLSFMQNGQDLLRTAAELKLLPNNYEPSQFRNADIGNATCKFIKTDLFNNLWGEIYLEPTAYTDTYFSLVTETVYNNANSFRTEKIAKPIAMAHPFIVAANPGFYRDLRNLGFQTFDHLIDESFDTIENHQDRMNRLADLVQNVVQLDLEAFVTASEDVCKYNQQHLLGFADSVRGKFPDRFFNFLNNNE
jgi:hypothetical protein